MRKSISNGALSIKNAALTSGIFKDLAYHFMQLSPNVFYTYDVKRNKFMWVNHDFNNLLGYEPHNEKLCTPAFIGITHADDAAQTIDFIKSWNEINNNVVREIAYRIADGEDEYRWINHKCRVIRRDEKGLAWRISGIVTDITDQKNIEQKLHENELLLMEKNRVLRELNYELALEIREREKAEKELKKAYTELETRCNIEINI